VSLERLRRMKNPVAFVLVFMLGIVAGCSATCSVARRRATFREGHNQRLDRG
jgi:hypothetical protein